MYLLDTNTLIYYFKGMGKVAEQLLATPPSETAISTVTLFELEVGIAKSASPSERRKQLDAMMSLVRLLPFARAESRAAASIRARLEKAGHPIGPLDNLIAGTAVAHGATLVTRNLTEFRRIRGLQAISWY